MEKLANVVVPLSLPPTPSSPGSPSLTNPPPAPIDPERAQYATERVRVLFGCYRKGDANDPELYTAALTAVLAEYPTEVIRAVTDPRSGLPRKLQWLPTVKEVSDACDQELKWRGTINFMAERGWVWLEDKWQRATDIERQKHGGV
jgi:hypothetical protein